MFFIGISIVNCKKRSWKLSFYESVPDDVQYNFSGFCKWIVLRDRNCRKTSENKVSFIICTNKLDKYTNIFIFILIVKKTKSFHHCTKKQNYFIGKELFNFKFKTIQLLSTWRQLILKKLPRLHRLDNPRLHRSDESLKRKCRPNIGTDQASNWKKCCCC